MIVDIVIESETFPLICQTRNLNT